MAKLLGQFVLLVWALFLLFAPMIPFLFLSGCQVSEPQPLLTNDGVGAVSPPKEPTNAFLTTADRKDEGGVSMSQFYSIQWGQDKAIPLEVLKSTLARMEHVQQTMNASDTNAKALFHVMQAVDILAGQEVKEIPQSTGSKPE